MNAPRILLALTPLLSLTLLAPLASANYQETICRRFDEVTQPYCFHVVGTADELAGPTARAAFCAATGYDTDESRCDQDGVLSIEQAIVCGIRGREPRVWTDLCVLP